MYANTKDLRKRTVWDKNCTKFWISKRNTKEGLVSVVYKIFDRKTGSEATSKTDRNANEVLVEELHKPVLSKFKRRKVCDIAEMRSLTSKSWSVIYLQGTNYETKITSQNWEKSQHFFALKPTHTYSFLTLILVW